MIVTPGDMADILTAIGAYDGRKISDIDVAAWHRAVGDLDRDDALEAVVRHHGHTTDWMKPAHLRQMVLEIRNERAAARQHEVRALPSRFEQDPERDDRISRGVRQGVHELVARWSIPGDDGHGEDPIHEAALARAKRERHGRPNPGLTQIRKGGGPGIQLDKVTRPPEWADAQAREAEAVRALHAAGRPCGRGACRTCNERAFAEVVVPIKPTTTEADHA